MPGADSSNASATGENGARLLSGAPRSDFYVEHGKDVLPPGWLANYEDLEESVENLRKMSK